ncbi:camp-dependent protein kinase pathway protein [Penicillium sp. IBT 35674x]|nr:camp-dependent protein kinase pathway protein [Penicillium sp. IBT 35674x]
MTINEDHIISDQENKVNPQLPPPDEQHTSELTTESQDSGLEGNNNPGKSDPPKPAEAEDDAISDDETSQHENDKGELSQICHANPGGVNETLMRAKVDLWDYQTQLMVLEQQNKRRLMIARHEQEKLRGCATQPAQEQTQEQMRQTSECMAIPDGERTGGSSPNPVRIVPPGPRQPSCLLLDLDSAPGRQEQILRSRL